MGQIGEKRKIVIIPKPTEVPREVPQSVPAEPVKEPEKVPVH